MNAIRAAAACALLAAATSWAAVDVEVRNGDKVTGTISPATETETIRFRVPKGALVTVKAAAAKKPLQLRVRLKDPNGVAVGDPVEGKSATIAKKQAGLSGLYSVEIASKDGVAVGDYTFAATWKSPTSFGGKRAVAGGVVDVDFAADAGATATFAAKKVKKSAAVPALSLLTYVPENSVDHLTGATDKRVVGRTGEFVLRATSPADGDVTATVKVKPPAPSKRKYALTAKAIGGGDAAGDTAFSAIVGPLGGSVVFPTLAVGQPGSQLDGSACMFPAGALPVGTSIVIATAPAIPTTGTQAAAGATVAFGPEGATFGTKKDPKSATVTIPFDPAFAAVQADVTIYTRDAKGRVTPVAKPYVFDVAAKTVSFATSHFSSFAAVSATPVAPAGPTMFTAATILGASDICEAHEPTGPPPRYRFFVASNSQRKVFGLVPQAAPSKGYDVELFAGGGSLNTDGTPRLQFTFPSIIAISAAPDGRVYVASPTRIFKIAVGGTVSAYAGGVTSGDTGDDGPAIDAKFNGIRAILADDVGNLYVADAVSRRIRIINNGDLIIRAWAGTGAFGVGVDGQPPATTTFVVPSHMAFANAGGLYVGDGPRLRRLDPATGANVTIAGDAAGAGGSADNDGSTLLGARFQIVYGVSARFDAVNGTDLIAVTDDLTNTVYTLDRQSDTVRRVGGQLNQSGSAPDAEGPPGPVNLPLGIVRIDGGTVFVDSGNGKIRGTKD